MTPATMTQFSANVARLLEDSGLEIADTYRVVKTALEEDLRYGPDLTSRATVPDDLPAIAELNARKPGRLAGVPVALAVFDLVLAGRYELVHDAADGTDVVAGEPVLKVRGDVRLLLTAERTALNLLCHLSGVATATAAWVDRIAGTNALVRDSRKTLPGLRLMQKYAVRRGGGVNHRFGLGDAVLIKDNHVAAAAAGSVSAALASASAAARALSSADSRAIPVEVEVDDLDALAEVLEAGAEEILLDNFTPDECAEAVRRRNDVRPATRLEASGGLTLDVARIYARTGVDYLAVGALTHSSPALDIGLDLRMMPFGTSDPSAP